MFQQKLFFKGTWLDEDKTLEEYGLEDEACIEYERCRKRKRRLGESVLTKLQRRETSVEGHRFFSYSSSEEKFQSTRRLVAFFSIGVTNEWTASIWMKVLSERK